MSSLSVSLALGLLLQPLLWAIPLDQYDPATCRGVSLADTPWPSDHGDSSRSKFTLGAGLPKNFTSEQIKRVDQNSLGNAQWIYTGGPNNEYIFAMGGGRSLWITKFDAITLEVVQKIPLQPGLYLGGLLIHKNGHVYCVHTNTLYRFWNGDLTNSSKFPLPSDLCAHKFVQTNGMLVTHDGLLAIKQWPFTLEDSSLYLLRFPIVIRVFFGFIIVTFSLLVRALSKKRYTTPKKRYFVPNVLNSLCLSFIICSTVMLAIICLFFLVVIGPYDPIKFIFSGWFLNSGGGELKLIDPITFEVRANVKLAERCSYARMAMTTFDNGEDVFVLLGDEFSHQYRWNSKINSLYYVPEWSKRYRKRWSGTFPGTGPSIFNKTAYYTDNTYPIGLFGRSYTIFRQTLLNEDERAAVVASSQSQSTSESKDRGTCVSSLQNSSECAMNAVMTSYPSFDIFHSKYISPHSKSPGFMFWSVTISPLVDNVIVWDTISSSVQSRHSSNLTLNWEVKAVQIDCLTVAADKGHVYFSDYDKNISGANQWLGKMFDMPDATKYFIVADTLTGAILLNMTVSSKEIGMKPALIVPGAHNDVIIGTSVGVSRLYV